MKWFKKEDLPKWKLIQNLKQSPNQREACLQAGHLHPVKTPITMSTELVYKGTETYPTTKLLP